MNCQMMRVISSPSSSTTGFATLILWGRWLKPRHPFGSGLLADGGVADELLVEREAREGVRSVRCGVLI
jgi:hypothetical protein